jgi:ApbE superfamily uncharacterized protein (UPF0280 family)
MTGAQAHYLADGDRLHLHHGPIDLVLKAEGLQACVQAAYKAAAERFSHILAELVEELPYLRKPPGAYEFSSPVACRMKEAVAPHAERDFVTPMAAVAGSVAQEILECMRSAAEKQDPNGLRRIYVNNGGDIALYLGQGEDYSLLLASLEGEPLGRAQISHQDNICGIATSGRSGRSLSLGIADSVTVFADTAANADVAATLVANHVTLEGHSGISRAPASEIDPDSDLGERLVVVSCEGLDRSDTAQALDAGAKFAMQLQEDGLLHSAALFLNDQSRLIGPVSTFLTHQKVQNYA